MDLSWLLPYVAPVLPAVVERASGLVTERLPPAARDLVPLVIGAGLGAVGHAAGLSPTETGILFGVAGPGAVAWHRARKRVTVTSHPGRDSRQVDPATLPPK